jgi:hypothetical protein
MYSLETLALLGTHDKGRRQANTKAQHNTTQKSKKMSSMGLTKIQVLAKRKQFLVGEDSQIYHSHVPMWCIEATNGCHLF